MVKSNSSTSPGVTVPKFHLIYVSVIVSVVLVELTYSVFKSKTSLILTFFG